jgi:hypothetical protein
MLGTFLFIQSNTHFKFFLELALWLTFVGLHSVLNMKFFDTAPAAILGKNKN